MRIVLIGPPGAGKGTQGALLARSHGVPRYATGDLLREAVRRDTELGRRAKRYMDAGELVPDDVILGVIREVLTDESDSPPPTHGDGFILDGFPRTLRQAKGLDRLLAGLGRPLDAVIVFDVPEEILIKRLAGRRTCTRCGAAHNVYFDPPRTPDVCDRCEGELVQRRDDEPETVRRRLQVYRQQTEPLIDYYRERPVSVIDVNGDRSVDEVRRSLEQVLAS